MAAIPTLTKLSREDFKDFEKDIPKLLDVLNTFMASMVDAMSSLTFAQNMRGVVKTIEFTHRTSTYPILFSWPFKHVRPTDVWISKFDTVSGTAPTAWPGPMWDFDDTNRVVRITQLFGLTTDSKYKIRVMAATN